jgi:hypothetical protein
MMSEKAKGKMKAVDLSMLSPTSQQQAFVNSSGGSSAAMLPNGDTNGTPYASSNTSTHSFESLPPEIANEGKDRDSDEFSLSSSSEGGGYLNWKKKKVEYVYDAAKERTRERLRAMGISEHVHHSSTSVMEKEKLVLG